MKRKNYKITVKVNYTLTMDHSGVSIDIRTRNFTHCDII